MPSSIIINTVNPEVIDKIVDELNEFWPKSVLKELYADFEKLNQSIKTFSEQETEENFNSIKEKKAEIDNKYPDDWISHSNTYCETMHHTLHDQIIETKNAFKQIQNAQEHPNSLSEFSEILNSLPYDKFQELLKILSGVNFTNIKNNTGTQNSFIDDFNSFFNTNYSSFFKQTKIEYLGGGNAKNIKITNLSTQESFVLKYDNRLDHPKSTETTLRKKINNNIVLPPTYYERKGTFLLKNNNHITSRLIITPYINQGNLIDFTQKKLEENNTKEVFKIYVKTIDFFKALQNEQFIFPDAKGENILIEEVKTGNNISYEPRFLDLKSILQTNVGQWNEKINPYSDIIWTPNYSPPIAYIKSYSSDKVHTYILGKNLEKTFKHHFNTIDKYIDKDLKNVIETLYTQATNYEITLDEFDRRMKSLENGTWKEKVTELKTLQPTIIKALQTTIDQYQKLKYFAENEIKYLIDKMTRNIYELPDIEEFNKDKYENKLKIKIMEKIKTEINNNLIYYEINRINDEQLCNKSLGDYNQIIINLTKLTPACQIAQRCIKQLKNPYKFPSNLNKNYPFLSEKILTLNVSDLTQFEKLLTLITSSPLSALPPTESNSTSSNEDLFNLTAKNFLENIIKNISTKVNGQEITCTLKCDNFDNIAPNNKLKILNNLNTINTIIQRLNNPYEFQKFKQLLFYGQTGENKAKEIIVALNSINGIESLNDLSSCAPNSPTDKLLNAINIQRSKPKSNNEQITTDNTQQTVKTSPTESYKILLESIKKEQQESNNKHPSNKL